MFDTLERPLIFFKTKTTGVDPRRDRIVELAALKLFPDSTREEKSRRFNPGIPISKEATAAHGLSDRDVRGELPFAKFAKGEQGISQYFAGCDLAGYHLLEFDLPILRAELERCGETLDLKDVSIVDSYRIFAHKEPQTLAGAAQFYCDKEHLEERSALEDVQMTIAVLEAQLGKYRDLGCTPAEVDRRTWPDGALDRLGKLRWEEDEIVVAFGRHRGRSLRFIANEEREYLQWMIAGNVLDPTGLAIVRDALLGHFPKKAGQ